MNDEKIISSLKIRKLFGEYDIHIDFKKITVLVGKNGLGKTTVLRIIHSLIMETYQVNYPSICESIELNFNDGNLICYGKVGDSFSRASSSKVVADAVLKNDDFFQNINRILSGVSSIPEKNREDVAKSFIKEIISQQGFTEKLVSYFAGDIDLNKKIVLIDESHRKKIRSELNVRYISTVNISANAVSSIDFGNSIEKNLLDMAIHEELRLLSRSESKEAVNSFTLQLNIFLKESGKKARQNEGEWIFKHGKNTTLGLDMLSSGEKQLVYILATAANTLGKPTLFLMDEPEVSLHLSWQEKIIDAIVGINPQMQVIAVTHSPGIVMDGYMDAYTEMKNVMTGIDDV